MDSVCTLASVGLFLLGFVRAQDSFQDSSFIPWDKTRLKFNMSSVAVLPDPQRQLGLWNASVVTDFDNTIPTFDYTNSSGDLASAASSYGGSRSYAEGRQYNGDKSYMALITYFDVKCDKSSMHVHVEFNKPFNGIIFSKGFFNNPDCRYVPAKSYGKIFDFTVPVNYCGTVGEDHGYDYKDSFAENTIIVQFDEYIQEVWDLAKTIRCEWNAYYDKSVAVRPFNVGNLDPVLYRFNGDNIESWIQVQKGKGPWAEEVYGIVKVGDPLTLVIGINDNDKKFDMQVKDCFATDGYGARVQLTDYYGCVVRDKIMSPFRKIKDYGAQASVVAYAYFQAFKFPDRYEVGIKCNIQVCLGKCQGGCPNSYSGDQKPVDTYEDKEPGYVAPPGYEGGGGAPPAYGGSGSADMAYGGSAAVPGYNGAGADQGYDKASYSSSVPTQNVDISQFGTGPYVPDIPPAPPGPAGPGPFLGAYDTNHVIGLEAPISKVQVDTKKNAASSGLEAYRRKRSSGSSNTTDQVNSTNDPSTHANIVVHSDFLKSARTPKLIADDGQINVDRKFKVIASHDIQSDNINAGPSEVSMAKSNAICIAVSSFTVAVTLLTAVLILSVLITCFVCFRLRRYSQKLAGNDAVPVKIKEPRYLDEPTSAFVPQSKISSVRC